MKDFTPGPADNETQSSASTAPYDGKATNIPTRFGDYASLFAALHFAAEKHRDQRRKGECASPYINHPIEVAEMLVRVGAVTDVTLLQAAVLHDTVEDTETTFEELEARFGSAVRSLVAEVTDDKTLSKEERKRLQVEHAPTLSAGARQVKLADKICNVRDVANKPPLDWSLERCAEYLQWSEAVVAGCRGVNERLEQEFDDSLEEARARLKEAPHPMPYRP
jgi:guanosine-3',5'-bis(diphosphate) 3'-pyrophosphohydrolase